MDVVTGALFGIIFASLTFYILDLTGKEYLFYKPDTGAPVREDCSDNPRDSEIAQSTVTVTTSETEKDREQQI